MSISPQALFFKILNKDETICLDYSRYVSGENFHGIKQFIIHGKKQFIFITSTYVTFCYLKCWGKLTVEFSWTNTVVTDGVVSEFSGGEDMSE
jgi:hypothetical protein